MSIIHACISYITICPKGAPDYQKVMRYIIEMTELSLVSDLSGFEDLLKQSRAMFKMKTLY